MISKTATRRAPEPPIRRFLKPIWVNLRLRKLLCWLPGPVLQWIRYFVYYGKSLHWRTRAASRSISW